MSIGAHGQCVSLAALKIQSGNCTILSIALLQEMCVLCLLKLLFWFYPQSFSSGGGSSSFPSGEEKPEIELCRLQVSSSQSFKYSIFFSIFFIFVFGPASFDRGRYFISLKK